MGKIRINNLTLFSHIGVLESEKINGQKLEIDLTLDFDFAKAAEFDSLEDTINYADVAATVTEIVEKAEYDLIEKLAYAILNYLHIAYPQVVMQTVAIRKYSVPMPGIFDNVEVELSMNQDGELI
ncbi:MAG: dihydroneopterin aldolase [Lactobacillales bacterium]|nr:dihydroneopterin aldolase [Lactobacillales bacterium]